MVAHDKIEAALDRLQQDLLVIDIDIELPLNGVVDQDARLHANVIVLKVPAGLKSYGHALPSVGIGLAQSVADYLYDPLGEHVGLERG